MEIPSRRSPQSKLEALAPTLTIFKSCYLGLIFLIAYYLRGL
jgi:hypothetical protein